MTDPNTPTPFRVYPWPLSPVIGGTPSRAATVAECRRAVGAKDWTERIMEGWFFPLIGGQEREDVGRWLRDNGGWELDEMAVEIDRT